MMYLKYHNSLKDFISELILDHLKTISFLHGLSHRPEMYLLGETSSQIGHELDDRARAELVEEYFSR